MSILDIWCTAGSWCWKDDCKIHGTCVRRMVYVKTETGLQACVVDLRGCVLVMLSLYETQLRDAWRKSDAERCFPSSGGSRDAIDSPAAENKTSATRLLRSRIRQRVFERDYRSAAGAYTACQSSWSCSGSGAAASSAVSCSRFSARARQARLPVARLAAAGAVPT